MRNLKKKTGVLGVFIILMGGAANSGEKPLTLSEITPNVHPKLTEYYQQGRNPLEKQLRDIFESNQIKIQEECLEIIRLKENGEAAAKQEAIKKLEFVLDTYFDVRSLATKFIEDSPVLNCRHLNVALLNNGIQPYGTEYDQAINYYRLEFLGRLLRIKPDEPYKYE